MKTLDQILLSIAGIILITAGVLIGRYLFPSIPEPKIEVKEHVIRDTVRVETPIKIFQKSKPTIIKDTTGSIQTVVDSIEGTKDQVEYKIKHTISGSKKFLSTWEIEVKPLISIIKEYVVKDSIQTVVDIRYVPEPFIMDTYFWLWIFQTGLTILALIY
jgi:hypothetical protein